MDLDNDGLEIFGNTNLLRPESHAKNASQIEWKRENPFPPTAFFSQ